MAAQLQKKKNPLIGADFPDPDVIRVEDTYYMLCSTMHFLPGGVILRSYDLLHWEIASYVFDSFGDLPEVSLDYEKNGYGCGMWAGCLRYHDGRFYVCFAARRTGRTFFYSAPRVEGPWECRKLDRYYHDSSLFFDDDGKVYLVYGNSEIWIRELAPDLGGFAPGGLFRRLVKDRPGVFLGYEGSHFYKIGGKYYLFVLDWPSTGTMRRTQYCFCGDSLEGEFSGGPVLDDDLGYHNCGVAQGGVVQAADGSWYSVLLQDHGAVGRVPVLVDVHWEDGFPVFGKRGKAPRTLTVESARPECRYEPIFTSDDFAYEPDENGAFHLKKQWQWNHEPEPELWTAEPEGGLRITTGKICANVTQAVNTLTQRLMMPVSRIEVTVDAGTLRDGDYAGLCALQGCYAMLAVTKQLGQYYAVLLCREKKEKDRGLRNNDYLSGEETARIRLKGAVVRMRMEADFSDGADQVSFSCRETEEGENWKSVGRAHQLYFGLDHFTGCRCGLAVYSTRKPGGSAVFLKFSYACDA